MGSKTFDGVWFVSYSHDHAPPHVHGEYGGVQVIVDLFPDGKTAKSTRTNAVRPRNAKLNDVRKILSTAAAHSQELARIWKETHGTAS